MPEYQQGSAPSVLCVDDNPDVAEAIQLKLRIVGGFVWKGVLASADRLVETAVCDCPTLVLLDVDMPGKDPFVTLSELVERCPETKAVVFSGHVRGDLVRRAVDAGAWGYVSKNDGADELVAALRGVIAGELALSPEARTAYNS